jgi:DNA polymerase III sliding clamp (beta) subunit (PCNA family)
MTIPYVTFIKHAEKITKSASASRPILKGVHHAKGGTLMVTDSRRLYQAKNAHSNQLDEVVDPKTGRSIDGNYPDVSRLIPGKNDAKFTVRIAVKESVDAFAALLKSNYVAGKYKAVTKAHVNDNGEIAFTVENQYMTSSYTVGSIDGEPGELAFDTSFMVDALNLFKAVGATELEFRYYGKLRPFTLTSGLDDELLALLLPIRMGDE